MHITINICVNRVEYYQFIYNYMITVHSEGVAGEGWSRPRRVYESCLHNKSESKENEETRKGIYSY